MADQGRFLLLFPVGQLCDLVHTNLGDDPELVDHRSIWKHGKIVIQVAFNHFIAAVPTLECAP